jgi:hypothetical protein
MLFLAVSTLDKLKDVPHSFWLKVAIGIAAFFVLVFALKLLAGVNKIFLFIIAFVAGGLIFFSWVYNRNEPAFLTPIVDRIAPFFPSAGTLGNNQAKTPDASPQPAPQAPPPSHVY